MSGMSQKSELFRIFSAFGTALRKGAAPKSRWYYFRYTFLFPLLLDGVIAGMIVAAMSTTFFNLSFILYLLLIPIGIAAVLLSIYALSLIYHHRKFTSRLTRFFHLIFWGPFLGAALFFVELLITVPLKDLPPLGDIASGLFLLLNLIFFVYCLTFFLYPPGFFAYERFFPPSIRYPEGHKPA